MPRIRDLGITFIPPAGGDGELRYLACQDENTCVDLSACNDTTIQPCTDEPRNNSCSEETAQCVPNSTGPEQYATDLGADVIAQLRQHLHDRLGAQLPL